MFNNVFSNLDNKFHISIWILVLIIRFIDPILLVHPVQKKRFREIADFLPFTEDLTEILPCSEQFWK